MSSPQLHLHQVDLIQQAALFLQLQRGAYRDASFLDGRSFPPDTPGGWINLQQVMQTVLGAPPPATPIHFIFHMGHTGSTLLSRLLDETDAVQSLREPLVLRELAALRDRRGDPDCLLDPTAIDDLGETMLRLWARCQPGRKCAILKATSSAGRIGEWAMAARPAARAVYLSMAAEPFLAVILGGPASLMDVRGHAEERMRRLTRVLGSVRQPLSALSPGEMVALAWLTEALIRERLARAVGIRLLQIDFDAFLQDVAAAVARVLAHFELPGGSEEAMRIAASPTLGRYAKAPEHAYSSRLRDDVMRDSRQRNRDEIARGMDLLESLAGQHDEAARLLS